MRQSVLVCLVRRASFAFTPSLSLNRLIKNSVCRLLKKISEARRAKNRSFGSAQDRLGVLERYVVARRFKRNEAYESFSAAC